MRSPLNILRGTPDDGRVWLTSVASVNGVDGYVEDRMTINYVGTACFFEQLRDARPWHVIWCGPGSPRESRIAPGPMVNYIADADACSIALEAAERAARHVRRPWFNHPASIRDTSRERISATLQSIPNVDMPRTIRLAPSSLEEILRAAEAIGYPVIVRIAGTHLGSAMVKLTDPADLTPLSEIPWVGKSLYLTAFREYRSDDGLYRKSRIAVIGGVPILRHHVIGRSWLVNANRRQWPAAFHQEETEVLCNPDSIITPNVRQAVEQIYQALRLDHFGIDFCLRPNGSMLIFEANACMDILNEDRSSDRWDQPVHTIRTLLLELLDQPERWITY